MHIKIVLMNGHFAIPDQSCLALFVVLFVYTILWIIIVCY